MAVHEIQKTGLVLVRFIRATSGCSEAVHQSGVKALQFGDQPLKQDVCCRSARGGLFADHSKFSVSRFATITGTRPAVPVNPAGGAMPRLAA